MYEFYIQVHLVTPSDITVNVTDKLFYTVQVYTCMYSCILT